MSRQDMVSNQIPSQVSQPTSLGRHPTTMIRNNGTNVDLAGLMGSIGRGLRFQKTSKPKQDELIVYDVNPKKRTRKDYEQDKETAGVEEEVEVIEKEYEQLLLDFTREEEEKSGIWNTNSHLYIWSRVSRCVEIVSASAATRLHPSVTDEINLNQYFVEQDSYTGLSPLTFAISSCVCVGAALAGEKEIESEFWMRARRSMEEFFDVTDIHVAAAFNQLADYAFSRGWEEQGKYYATLGVSICEQLRGWDSKLYLSLLVQCYFSGPNPSPSTFWNKIRLTSFGQSLSTASANRIFAKSSATATDTTTNRDESLDILSAELTLHIIGAFSMLMMQPENTLLHLALEDMLTSLRHNWLAARHVFNPGFRLRLEIALLGTMTAVMRSTGNLVGALNSAIVLTERATHDPLFPFLFLVREGLYWPMKVLKDTENWFILQTLLRAVQSNHSGTFLSGSLEEFKQHL